VFGGRVFDDGFQFLDLLVLGGQQCFHLFEFALQRVVLEFLLQHLLLIGDEQVFVVEDLAVFLLLSLIGLLPVLLLHLLFALLVSVQVLLVVSVQHDVLALCGRQLCLQN
jgi:hypothetical protein